MNEYLLHHMYQAWQQGNNEYVIQYKNFALYASKHTNIPYTEMLDYLKTCKWFKYISDE